MFWSDRVLETEVQSFDCPSTSVSQRRSLIVRSLLWYACSGIRQVPPPRPRSTICASPVPMGSGLSNQVPRRTRRQGSTHSDANPNLDLMSRSFARSVLSSFTVGPFRTSNILFASLIALPCALRLPRCVFCPYSRFSQRSRSPRTPSNTSSMMSKRGSTTSRVVFPTQSMLEPRRLLHRKSSA